VPEKATQPPNVVPVYPAPTPSPVAAPAVANAGDSGKSAGFQPIAAPPLPVTAEQEVALQALLKQYIANQVTPDQYQAERAKILGRQ
jgi:hypothetical protein